jgi:hypothetical protein
MDDQVAQITELFAAPRGTLQLALNYGGVKIYTSSVLRQNFVKAMSKSSRTAPVVSTIVKLMGKGEFVPCYLTDRIIKTILRKQPPEFKGYAGQTIGKYILVFVDNDTNIFGFASNNDLSITTLHELIHKASNKFPKQFYQTFKSELTTYYKNYWSQLFAVERNGLDDKSAQKIINFLYGSTERGIKSNKILVEYHRMLLETFKDISTLKPEKLQKMVTDYIVLIEIIWKGMTSGVPSLIEKVVFANRQIVVPLYTSYKTTFGINVKYIKELCYQELYAPSEVISLPALIKRPSQKVYKMINKL